GVARLDDPNVLDTAIADDERDVAAELPVRWCLTERLRSTWIEINAAVTESERIIDQHRRSAEPIGNVEAHSDRTKTAKASDCAGRVSRELQAGGKRGDRIDDAVVGTFVARIEEEMPLAEGVDEGLDRDLGACGIVGSDAFGILETESDVPDDRA